MLSSTRNRIRHRVGDLVTNQRPSIITISIAESNIRHRNIGWRGLGIIGVLQSFIFPTGSKIGYSKMGFKRLIRFFLRMLSSIENKISHRKMGTD